MSLAVRFVPLPRPERLTPRRSEFATAYSRTLLLLARELEMLGAQNVVIQAGFRPNQIRNDGWPYSGARPEHPAVVISFRSRKKDQDLAFPCARYERFEDNIRAIALSLEALRAVDRYGVTQRAEQYTGWAQLPPAAADTMTRESAAIWLASASTVTKDLILDSDNWREEAYKKAARTLHPDLGGSHEEFVQLGRVMEILRGTGGGK